MVFAEFNEPRLQRKLATKIPHPRINPMGGAAANRSATVLLSTPSTTRSFKSGTQAAVDRVMRGVVVQDDRGLASSSLLEELNRVKRRNVELSHALEDKTAQLEEALKQVSGLKRASQKVKKQLVASRMEESKCQIKLKDAVKVIGEAKKKLKHVMDDHKKLQKKLSESKKSPRFTEASARPILIQAKERFGGDQRKRAPWMYQESHEEEEESKQCTGSEELQFSCQLSGKEQDQLGWKLFQDLIDDLMIRDGCK
uniref:AlNc14C63G4544 protein n=1 Tax=Albugo laibachii Nc14 TaxID=890382 RepID=F0WD21_9STRA|nr:AlNc14C63G4544 [Albugo laibachii Nc14]|eukprot:CCA19093.1 AlNc14C63G4544 [Albugo laibachii Nc14]